MPSPDRAGVTYPSLYRFFADREEILDQLVTHHLAALDARAVATERTWQITSARDAWPGAGPARRLFQRAPQRCSALAQREKFAGGRRTSPPAGPGARRTPAPGAGRRQPSPLPTPTPTACYCWSSSSGDRILDLAFRDRSNPDPMIIELGRTALNSYAHDALDVSDE